MSINKYLSHVHRILYQDNNPKIGQFMIYVSDNQQLCTILIRGGKARHHTFKRDIIDAAFMIDDSQKSALITLDTKGHFFIYRQWYFQFNRYNRMRLPIVCDEDNNYQYMTLSGSSCAQLHLTLHEEVGETTYHITEEIVTLVDHLLM